MDSLNLYGYLRGNPTIWTDSLGLCTPGAVKNGHCEFKVLSKGTNPALEDSLDQIALSAEELENLEWFVESMELGGGAAEFFFEHSAEELAAQAAAKGYSISKSAAEDLSQKVRNLASKITDLTGELVGFTLYVKLSYDHCLKSPSILQCLTHWFGNTPPASYSSTLWDHVDGYWAPSGSFESKLAAYVAADDACYDRRKEAGF